MNKFKNLLLVLTSLTTLAYAPPREQLTRAQIQKTLARGDLTELRRMLQKHSDCFLFDKRPHILRQILAMGSLDQLEVIFEEGASPSKEIIYGGRNFGTPLIVLTRHRMNLDPGQDGFLANLQYLEYKKGIIRRAIDRERTA